LRDGDSATAARLARQSVQPVISIVTRVELEGGVFRNPAEAAVLRPRLDLMLSQFQELPFTSAEASAYGRIVDRLGFSRGRIIDRMIAAQAIVAGARLATLNARDFRNIPDLMLDDWSVHSA
jgi:predicted nucleic acid-binding protein